MPSESGSLKAPVSERRESISCKEALPGSKGRCSNQQSEERKTKAFPHHCVEV